MAWNMSSAVRSWWRASRRRLARRSHWPYSRCVRGEIDGCLAVPELGYRFEVGCFGLAALVEQRLAAGAESPCGVSPSRSADQPAAGPPTPAGLGEASAGSRSPRWDERYGPAGPSTAAGGAPARAGPCHRHSPAVTAAWMVFPGGASGHCQASL
jgi:hypothetical protein